MAITQEAVERVRRRAVMIFIWSSIAVGGWSLGMRGNEAIILPDVRSLV
jgi:hypothetical protein